MVLLDCMDCAHRCGLLDLLHIVDGSLRLDTCKLPYIFQFLRIDFLHSLISLTLQQFRFRSGPGFTALCRFRASSSRLHLSLLLPRRCMSFKKRGAKLLIVISPINSIKMALLYNIIAHKLVRPDLIVRIHDLAMLIIAYQIHINQRVVRNRLPLFIKITLSCICYQTIIHLLSFSHLSLAPSLLVQEDMVLRSRTQRFIVYALLLAEALVYLFAGGQR